MITFRDYVQESTAGFLGIIGGGLAAMGALNALADRRDARKQNREKELYALEKLRHSKERRAYLQMLGARKKSGATRKGKARKTPVVAEYNSLATAKLKKKHYDDAAYEMSRKIAAWSDTPKRIRKNWGHTDETMARDAHKLKRLHQASNAADRVRAQRTTDVNRDLAADKERQATAETRKAVSDRRKQRRKQLAAARAADRQNMRIKKTARMDPISLF